MKKILLFFGIVVTIFSCSSPKSVAFEAKGIYKSDNLMVLQISENAFQHISYLQTNDFGNVPCNGMVVKNNKEAIVFDCPTNDKSSEELIKWVTEKLDCKINAVIPTHFHKDCLGGLPVFDLNNISSYAHFKTIDLAQQNKFVVPKNGFNDSLTLKLGTKSVTINFFGEGHTKDNVVGYFPSENVLFGGCLIKELNASKGYLGDANVSEWSETVEKVRKAYLNVKVVVPGHGACGNQKLLDYTIKLFQTD
ncbi:MAG: subclass B1 metallo-beta-lactamase [Saprospiraceae bacterium]|nr:subclass B1 metallo-beta-lactamase [Saprospiraceae bacterium]